ncbi:unnamed protein product, partial [Prorocentrum cordatum]
MAAARPRAEASPGLLRMVGFNPCAANRISSMLTELQNYDPTKSTVMISPLETPMELLHVPGLWVPTEQIVCEALRSMGGDIKMNTARCLSDPRRGLAFIDAVKLQLHDLRFLGAAAIGAAPNGGPRSRSGSAASCRASSTAGRVFARERRNTISALGALPSGLRWQLGQVPEAARSLNHAQSALDQTASYATSAAHHPPQIEEGLASVFQQLHGLQRAPGSFEGHGETLGAARAVVGALRAEKSKAQEGMDQMAHVLVHIGNSVAALVASADADQLRPFPEEEHQAPPFTDIVAVAEPLAQPRPVPPGAADRAQPPDRATRALGVCAADARGWESQQDISGQIRFLNRRTGNTQWHHPAGAAKVQGLRDRLDGVRAQLAELHAGCAELADALRRPPRAPATRAPSAARAPAASQSHPEFPDLARNPLAHARPQTPAQLQQALVGWLMRFHGAAPAVVGAEPPYTLALGGAPQPDLDITFAAQPWTALPAQLLNAPQGKLIAEGARSALEHNVEESLAFFSPCTELISASPPAPTAGQRRVAASGQPGSCCHLLSATEPDGRAHGERPDSVSWYWLKGKTACLPLLLPRAGATSSAAATKATAPGNAANSCADGASRATASTATATRSATSKSTGATSYTAAAATRAIRRHETHHSEHRDCNRQRHDAFLVDNSELKATAPGLYYRRKPSLDDTDRKGVMVRWGDTVNGTVTECGRFVKVGGRYLPLELGGCRVLRSPLGDSAAAVCAPAMQQTTATASQSVPVSREDRLRSHAPGDHDRVYTHWSRYASARDLLSLDLADRSHDQGSGRPPRVLEEAVRRSGPLASRDAPKHTLGAPDAARRPDSFLGTRDSSTVPADILGLAADIAAAAPRFDDSQFSSSEVAPSYDHLPAMTESEYDDSYLSFSQSGGGPQELSRPMAEEERSYSRSSFGERTVSNQPSRDPRDNMHNMHFSERCSAQQVLVSAMRWGRVVSHESVMARAEEQSEAKLRRQAQRQILEAVKQSSRLLLVAVVIYGSGRLFELVLRSLNSCPWLWRDGKQPQGSYTALASLTAEGLVVFVGFLAALMGIRRPCPRRHYFVLLVVGLYMVALPLFPTEPSCDDRWRYQQCTMGKDLLRPYQQGCGPQGLTASVANLALICTSPHIVPELRHLLLFVALDMAGYVAASVIYLYVAGLGYYTWVDIMVATLLIAVAIVMAAYTKYRMRARQKYMNLLYQRKAHASMKLLDLLQDFLPDHIITQMLKNPNAISAEQIPKASVLFVVISDFHGHMSRRSPDQLLDFLNTLFRKIDRICFDCQVTKIETVGEEFVAAVGVEPEDYSNGSHNHGDVLSRLIVAAVGIFMAQEGDEGEPLTGVQFRMGLHTGPVVAGVIGQKLPRFRLFGDTMNTAARMMQKGLDGELQFGEETRACMPTWARYRSRGKVEMKGKGQVDAYLLDRLGEDSGGNVWEQIRSYGLRKARRGSLDSIMSHRSWDPDDDASAEQEQEDLGTGSRSAGSSIFRDTRLKRLEHRVANYFRGGSLFGGEVSIEWLQEFYYFRIASHLGRRSDRLAAVILVLTLAEVFVAEMMQPRMGDVLGMRRTWLFLVMRATLLALIFRWRIVAQNKDWILHSPAEAELWRLAHACASLVLQFIAYGLLSEIEEFNLDLSVSQARDEIRREPLRVPLWQMMFLLWYGVTVMGLQLRVGPTVCFVAFSLPTPYIISSAVPALRNVGSSVQLVSMFIMGVVSVQIAGIDETQDRERYMAEKQVKFAQHRMDSILSQLLPPLVASEMSRRPNSVKILHHRQEYSHFYQQATIACSDLVGFTALASTRTATEVVELVSDLFGRFDGLSDVYRICKIETVGDAYIAGQAARPLTSVYRPVSVVLFASEIVEAVRGWSRDMGVPLDCRVGVHTGECVGGVVGAEMKRYHLFGHMLSALELLESTAPTGQVHLSGACLRALQAQATAEGFGDEVVVCTPRTELVLKTSKGDLVLYQDIGGAPTFVVQRCAPELYDLEVGVMAESEDKPTVSASMVLTPASAQSRARTPLGASRHLHPVPI